MTLDEDDQNCLIKMRLANKTKLASNSFIQELTKYIKGLFALLP